MLLLLRQKLRPALLRPPPSATYSAEWTMLTTPRKQPLPLRHRRCCCCARCWLLTPAEMTTPPSYHPRHLMMMTTIQRLAREQTKALASLSLMTSLRRSFPSSDDDDADAD